MFAEAVELGSQLVQLGVGVVAGQPDGFSVTVVGVICSVKVLLLPLVYDGDAVEEDVERKYILCELKRGSMYQRGAGGNSLGGGEGGGGKGSVPTAMSEVMLAKRFTSWLSVKVVMDVTS